MPSVDLDFPRAFHPMQPCIARPSTWVVSTMHTCILRRYIAAAFIYLSTNLPRGGARVVLQRQTCPLYVPPLCRLSVSTYINSKSLYNSRRQTRASKRTGTLGSEWHSIEQNANNLGHKPNYFAALRLIATPTPTPTPSVGPTTRI